MAPNDLAARAEGLRADLHEAADLFAAADLRCCVEALRAAGGCLASGGEHRALDLATEARCALVDALGGEEPISSRPLRRRLADLLVDVACLERDLGGGR